MNARTSPDVLRVVVIEAPTTLRCLCRSPRVDDRRTGVLLHRRWRRHEALHVARGLTGDHGVVRDPVAGHLTATPSGWALSTASTSDALVVAARRHGRIGVDVVSTGRRLRPLDLVTVLHPAERRLLDSIPDPTSSTLRSLVARKEAALKLLALAGTPQSLDCSVTGTCRSPTGTVHTHEIELCDSLVAVAWLGDTIPAIRIEEHRGTTSPPGAWQESGRQGTMSPPPHPVRTERTMPSP